MSSRSRCRRPGDFPHPRTGASDEGMSHRPKRGPTGKSSDPKARAPDWRPTLEYRTATHDVQTQSGSLRWQGGWGTSAPTPRRAPCPRDVSPAGPKEPRAVAVFTGVRTLGRGRPPPLQSSLRILPGTGRPKILPPYRTTPCTEGLSSLHPGVGSPVSLVLGRGPARVRA